MRRVLATAIALAGAAGTAARAQPAATVEAEPPTLRLDGSFFSRYELRDNYTGVDRAGGRLLESDGVAYRARLGLTTSEVDIGRGQTVSLRFAPQASGFWADSQNTLADAQLGVHEAAMTLKAPHLRVEVGRFEMAYGEHLVIGNVGWHETGRAFDGARVRVTPGADTYVDSFVTLLQEGRSMTASSMGDGDQLFGGVYAGVGPALAAGLELDVYALGQMWAEATSETMTRDSAFQLTIGTRAKYARGVLDYRGETGVQIGKRPNADGDAVSVLAYQGEAEVGVTLPRRVRVALTGFFASGDDPSSARAEGWDQLFPTAHKFLGLSDIIGGRTNIAGGSAGVRHAVGDRLRLLGTVFAFARPETGASDHYAGSELDAGAAYMIGEGLALRGLYALFLPSGSDLYPRDDSVHYVEVELRYQLK